MAEMTQEEINKFVEGIKPFFEQTPIPEDADQVSWPRLDRGLSDQQDMKRHQHLYGIWDRGGRPFWLTDFRNDDNTALLTTSSTLGTAECTMRGAFQMMRRPRRVHLPMPPAGGKPVTYFVTSEYSPQRASEGGDPIEIVTTTGPPSYAQGRDYIVHWEVSRNPNELLTSAKVVQRRPKVTPLTHVDRRENLPDPRTQLWGAMFYIRYGHEAGAIVIASGESPEEDEKRGGPTKWEPLNHGGWRDIGLSSPYTSGWGNTPQYRVEAGYVELRGIVELKSKGDLRRGAVTQFGWIPGLDMSPFKALPVAASGARSCRVETMQGKPTYNDLAFYTEEPIKWFCLDGIRFTIKGWVNA